MALNFRHQDLAYTIISRFEESFRNFISYKLSYFYTDFKDGIPNGILNKAIERNMELDMECCDDLLQETDFIDLKEIILYKKSYDSYFNKNNLNNEDFSNKYDTLYELRCKIAHNKPFSVINLDLLIEIVTELSYEIRPYSNELINYLETLKKSPEKVTVVTVPLNFDDCKNLEIPNNLPTPDYEYEGGFVGRKRDIEQVKRLLLGDLHRVISITGAGGVGKTSLAIKVLDDILIKNRTTFDYIIWLSAKDKKLSYLGVEEIEPTLKDYEELLDKIIEVTGFDDVKLSSSLKQKETNVNLILDMCSNLLIVIDNLETITDERIKNFILDCHPKIKILITSRRGLGQVNRVYELKELTEKEAICLFRLICRDKNLNHIAKLPDKIIKSYVRKVSYYPLAIKWLIGQVAKGKRINDVINSISDETSDITKFCFEQIYNELSKDSQKVLCALSCFDESPSYGVLNYVTDLNSQEFEDAVNELITVSLVIPEQYVNQQENLSTKYVLLPLTRGFINNQLDKTPSIRRNIQEKLSKVKLTNEEAIKAKNQFTNSFSNMGAVTDEEKVASLLLQTARQRYQEGLYDMAKADYINAQQIAPDFPTVYKNWSLMEAQERHFVEAEKLIKKAFELNSDDPKIWFTWGKIDMRNDNMEEALKKYEKAYSIDNKDLYIINALGYAKCRLGLHEDANELYEKGLKISIEQKSKKNEIICRTNLADNLRRWADVYKIDKNYKMAEEKLFEALEHTQKALKMDNTDPHTKIHISKINLDLAFLYKSSDINKSLQYFKNAIIENPIKPKAVNCTVKAINEIVNILNSQGKLDLINEYVPVELFEFIKKDIKWSEKISEIQNKINQKPIQGKIIRYDIKRMFCIIENNEVHGDTYLGHFNDFTRLDGTQIYKLKNKIVTFVPINNDGQMVAKMITIIN